MKIALPLCWSLLALSAHAADEPAAPDPNQPKQVTIRVSAAAEPRPALRFQLLPRLADRQAGNAAPFYYRALLALKTQQKNEAWKQYEKNYERWNGPAASFPAEEVREWLKSQGNVLAQVRTATRRERCEWDWRLQDIDGTKVFLFILEEIQEARTLSRMLALKAKLEIHEGKFDEALLTLQDGFQLARNLNVEPLLINGLVAVAVTAQMEEVLLDWINLPGSPNLFWAISALPRPFIDMRPALVFEGETTERALPMLKDAEFAQRTPEEWLQTIEKQLQSLHNLTGGPDQSLGWLQKAAFYAALPAAYENAKKELTAAGFDARRLEKMPIGQVLAVQSQRATRHASQEMLKYHLLDDPQNLERAAAAEKRLKDEGYLAPALQGKDPFGIAGLILPATASVSRASYRLQRNTAALQVLEAVRMHLAETGKLPTTLEEITVVPPPANPATGKPFSYLLKEGNGVLALPSVANPQDGAVYTLKLTPPTK